MQNPALRQIWKKREVGKQSGINRIVNVLACQTSLLFAFDLQLWMTYDRYSDLALLNCYSILKIDLWLPFLFITNACVCQSEMRGEIHLETPNEYNFKKFKQKNYILHLYMSNSTMGCNAHHSWCDSPQQTIWGGLAITHGFIRFNFLQGNYHNSESTSFKFFGCKECLKRMWRWKMMCFPYNNSTDSHCCHPGTKHRLTLAYQEYGSC